MAKAKSNDLNVICEFCGNAFHLFPSEIEEGRRFCSPECYHQSRIVPKLPNNICQVCEKPFRAKAVDVARGRSKFCSRKCFFIGREDGGPIIIPAEKRFKKYIGKPEKNGCILWKGAINEDGYGSLLLRKRVTISAHRFAWILVNGEIPEGLQVLHNCPGGDNPACVNVEHLWLGTQAENMADRSKKNRQDSKLSPEQVKEIRRRFAAGGIFQRELALEFGVAQSCICHIILGDTWKHLGDENIKKNRINSRIKLTPKEVQDIRRLYHEFGISKIKLAKDYGVCVQNIYAIITRRNWKNISTN